MLASLHFNTDKLNGATVNNIIHARSSLVLARKHRPTDRYRENRIGIEIKAYRNVISIRQTNMCNGHTGMKCMHEIFSTIRTMFANNAIIQGTQVV